MEHLSSIDREFTRPESATEGIHAEIAEVRGSTGAASKEALFVVVNGDGKNIGKKQYVDVHFFSEGKVGVKEPGKKWTFIDAKGKDLGLGEFDEVYAFHQGIAGVRNGARWKFIREDGSTLNEKTYDAVEDFDGEFGYGKRKGTWYTVDKSGNESVYKVEALAA